MKFSAVVDSKSEMKYFQKLKRDKQLRYTKFVQILEKKEIRFYLERWRRVCAKILQGIRKTEFFIMRRALRGKLKILHLLKRNSELDKAKRGKILRASDFFYMKKCRTSVSHWKILIRSSQEKREKFALSILHWSTYKKWTIFNLYKAQVQYELRLRYLKAHAYHCYKKFSAKILLRKFLNFFDSKKEIKKERQKACRMHIKNQKKKVINRLKKKVENSRFWRKKTQSLSYGNVEKANIFVAFGRRLEEIKGKRLELEKEEMYLFWAKYSKIRREKRSKRNEKVGKMVKKHGKQLEKECFYEWSRYQTEKIERARKEVFLKEKNNKEMRENVIKVLKENVRNKTAMKIRMEGAERSYIKYFLRIGFKTIHLNYQKSISKGLANTKAVTFACKMTMKKPLKAMKNYALAKNEKRHQIASLLSSHKAVLQKNFIKAILNHYMFTKITQKKQTNTLNKFLGFWSKFTQSHTQKSQKKLQLFSKISQKMQEIKKRNQFALWKEYHRKQFIKSLMNRKYTEFYNEKIVKKMYEALYFYYIKKNLSKRKMMKSEIFHSQSLKKFGLSYLFSHHELVSWKKAQIMKSLKFWCKKIKVFHFKIMKNNYKLKLIRRLRYKEVKELRKKDLQKDIVQKWFKVGIYWKEKEEVEYSSEQAKKDEKIWKLVQKIGSFWLSKIRRNVKPKISPPKPSQIPCKSPSKISQIDISYSAKPRPPPRRLH